MAKYNVAAIKLKSQADEFVNEYLLCKTDFEYFCLNYIKIEAPGGDLPLTPYQKQTQLVRAVEKHKFILVLKSRQIGISTIIQAYAAWLATFYPNVVVGIISKNGKEATHFARTIRGMIEKLPDWMKPPRGLLGRGFAKRTEQSFILTNGAKVYAEPVNPNRPENTLRGKAVTLLVIDEAAFVDKIDEAWTAMVPTLSTNQMQARKAGVPYGTVILSTPNKTVGIGQWYFNRYQRCLTGDDIFKPFVIHWKKIKELAEDPAWYETQCRLFDNDPKKIAQELELKFLPAEGSFFESDTIEKVQNAAIKPIEKLKLYNGEIWKFSEPIPQRYYITGVDTAPEHGEDKSAITIFDYETMEQVWEYRGKCKVLDFVKVVKVAVAQYPGIAVIESNSYGNQVVEQMMHSEFSHFMYQEKRGQRTMYPGLSTNTKTRPLMIDALYSYITQFPEIVKSERLALELAGLVTKPNGRVEADSNCHDDLALATACCAFVRKYDPPLMISIAQQEVLMNEMVDLINLNSGKDFEMENSRIIKHVKENLDEMGGFVDIMSLYDSQ
jgi:hypothetical protein